MSCRTGEPRAAAAGASLGFLWRLGAQGAASTHDLPRLLVGLGLVQFDRASALAGQVSVFVGPAAGPRSVRVLDESGGAAPEHPPALRGIRLLPLELAGRTQLEELLPGRARWRDDVPGASRLRLPGGTIRSTATSAAMPQGPSTT